jgi:hypothetical protein
MIEGFCIWIAQDEAALNTFWELLSSNEHVDATIITYISKILHLLLISEPKLVTIISGIMFYVVFSLLTS